MRFGPVEIKDKKGRTILLRNAEIRDAQNLIDFMKASTAETPFLIREPGEFNMTLEQEEAFIERYIENQKALMLIAVTMSGEYIGNCSLMRIGRIMLETVLSAAEKAGYEQAELEVIADNEKAVQLYQKLGFRSYGTFPDNMKYSDGTYADAIWMMKKLGDSYGKI